MANNLEYGDIIYYGAGDFGRKVYSYIASRNNVISWLDKNKSIDKCNNLVIRDPEILKTINSNEYDKLLVAVEKEEVFEKIKDELLKIYSVSPKKIIWLAKDWKAHMREVRWSNIDINRINKNYMNVIDIYKNKNEVRKIKVAFFFGGGVQLWNSIKTLVAEFQCDQKYSIKVVLLGNVKSSKYDIIKKDVNNLVYSEEYDVEEEKADIAFLNPYAEMPIEWLKKISDNTRLFCQIPFVLVKNKKDIRDHCKMILHNLDIGVHFSIHDKLIYDEMRFSGILDERIINIGNPKFDNIYNIVNNKNLLYPSKWQKLKDKKIILWTTDHVWSLGNITFDLYFEKIFQWFQNEEAMGLIFRPHPLYIQELVEEKIWDKEQIECLKDFFHKSKNMVFDDSADYSLAYKMADGIICDINCGITVSALPLGKPLAVMRRYDDFKEEPLHPMITDKLYHINSISEAYQFFEMVNNGMDPKKQQREEAAKIAINNFDGKNAKRIKKFIMNEYNKRISTEQ